MVGVVSFVFISICLQTKKSKHFHWVTKYYKINFLFYFWCLIEHIWFESTNFHSFRDVNVMMGGRTGQCCDDVSRDNLYGSTTHRQTPPQRIHVRGGLVAATHPRCYYKLSILEYFYCCFLYFVIINSNWHYVIAFQVQDRLFQVNFYFLLIFFFFENLNTFEFCV